MRVIVMVAADENSERGVMPDKKLLTDSRRRIRARRLDDAQRARARSPAGPRTAVDSHHERTARACRRPDRWRWAIGHRGWMSPAHELPRQDVRDPRVAGCDRRDVGPVPL